MNRAEHLATAEAMLRLVAQLMRGTLTQRAAVAEMVWGATVHALSAARPFARNSASYNARERRQGLPHRRPKFQWERILREQRCASLIPTCAYPTWLYLETCLDKITRGKLHTHFYHLNLSRSDFTVKHERRQLLTCSASLPLRKRDWRLQSPTVFAILCSQWLMTLDVFAKC